MGLANPLYRILDIVRGTTVDGPGFRTAIYFSGCSHHCPGCHNPQSWDPENGKEMFLSEILDIIREEDFDVTLTGGDPLFMNTDDLIVLLKEVKNLGYDIWLYTGFTIEEIRDSGRLRPVLEYVDTIVDGPFIEELRDPDLPFRGSANQNIIRLHD